METRCGAARILIAGLLPLAAASCEVRHEYQTTEFSSPAGDIPARQADDDMASGGPDALEVVVSFPAGGARIHAGSGESLYRATVIHCVKHMVASANLRPPSPSAPARLLLALQGRPGVFLGFGGEHNQMDLSLPAGIPQALDLDLGEGESVIDLSGLRVRRLRLMAGAGDTRVIFGEPNLEAAGEVQIEATVGDISVDRLGSSNAGRSVVRGGVGNMEIDLTGPWRRDASVEVEASVGDVYLRLPAAGPAIRMEVGNPWGHGLEVAGFAREDGILYSAGVGAEAPRLEVKVAAGIGALTVEREASDPPQQLAEEAAR